MRAIDLQTELSQDETIENDSLQWVNAKLTAQLAVHSTFSFRHRDARVKEQAHNGTLSFVEDFVLCENICAPVMFLQSYHIVPGHGFFVACGAPFAKKYIFNPLGKRHMHAWLHVGYNQDNLCV